MINKIKKLYICYPSGNINAIIEDVIPKQDYSLVAERIINLYNKNKTADKQIEQVAFISKNSLTLSGGEFSGNAAMCLGKIKLKNKEKRQFQVSGSKQLLKIFINNNGYINGQMPLFKLSSKLKQSKEGFPIIPLQGITQILVSNNFNKNVAYLKNMALKIIENNNLERSLAVAVVFTKNENNFIKIKPFVYFKKGVKYEISAETSCGSATIATGIYSSIMNNQSINNQEVAQPSGDSLYVTVKKIKNQFESYLSEKVKIIYEGPFDLNNQL
ncbi:MAG: hypothetical protein WC744_00895 [Patescibacteria group bacterium]|jgi:diaminopimelate epimerase